MEEIIAFLKENKRKLVPISLFLILAFSIFFFKVLRIPTLGIIGEKVSNEVTLTKAKENNCSIEYGKPLCYKERYYIPFYNPNNVSIERVEVYVPKSLGGYDVYKVNKSLPKNETRVLRTYNCKGNPSRFSLKWCCQECYRIKMVSPSSELSLNPPQ